VSVTIQNIDNRNGNLLGIQTLANCTFGSVSDAGAFFYYCGSISVDNTSVLLMDERSGAEYDYFSFSEGVRNETVCILPSAAYQIFREGRVGLQLTGVSDYIPLLGVRKGGYDWVALPSSSTTLGRINEGPGFFQVMENAASPPPTRVPQSSAEAPAGRSFFLLPLLLSLLYGA
jgi:hypothetical protein